MFKFRYIVILLLLSSEIQAQRRIYQAHWQNRADFDIKATLDPSSNMIMGQADIVYYNNSRDTLREIYFHLWPNAYKNRNTPLAKQLLESGNVKFHYAHDSLRGFMDQTDFRIEGKPLMPLSAERDAEIKKQFGDEVVLLLLPEPLLPGKKVVISTPFRVKIPGVFSRLGREKGFYAISQWYPKPAVYDANGWHPMVYLNQGEFYSEFGRYDVKIKVPQGYEIAAAGVETALPAKGDWKGYRRFVQDSIHDFAWFSSPKLKSVSKTITLPSGKKVECIIYEEKDPSPQGTDMIASAVEFYSRRVGDYPYAVCKAVVGPLKAGGGMEYPTITIVDDLQDRVILHEVGHNWFYGILASDERSYPWMDEGVNSYYEALFYEEDTMPEKFLSKNRYTLKGTVRNGESKEAMHLFYRKLAGEHIDQAAGLPAAEYTEANYGAIVYGKTALLFDYLADYLGQEMFTKCMREYYKRYAFRHPLPADMKLTFEEVSGRDLGWFFDKLINTEGSPDIRIKRVIEDNDSTALVTTENTGFQVPFVINAYDRRGKELARTWLDTAGVDQKVKMPKGTVKLVVDGFELMPEVKRRNNYYYKNQLMGRFKQPSIRLAGAPENPGKSRIFIMPAVGYNNYNKFMAGISVYNSLIPRSAFEYAVTPLYSFKTGTITGLANVQINTYPFKPESVFNKLELGVDASSFRMRYFTEEADYYRLSPYLNFRYKAKKGAFYDNYLQLRYTNLDIHALSGDNKFSLYPLRNIVDLTSYTSKKHALRPFTTMVKAEYAPEENGAKGFIKLSAVVEQRFRYKGRKKFVDIRAFAGTFIGNSDKVPGEYHYRLSGASGLFDYSFRQLYMGRTDRNGLFESQLSGKDAFFKSPAWIGSSNKWMAAINLKSSLPGLIPFKVFADLGTFADASDISAKGSSFFYNAGVMLSLAHNVAEIYFPIVQSKEFNDYYALNYERGDKINYQKRITFILQLDKLRPVKSIREIKGI